MQHRLHPPPPRILNIRSQLFRAIAKIQKAFTRRIFTPFRSSLTHEADIAHPFLKVRGGRGWRRVNKSWKSCAKVVATRVKASFRTCARSITSATSTTPPWLPRPSFIERSRVGYAPSDVTGTRGREIPGEGLSAIDGSCAVSRGGRRYQR